MSALNAPASTSSPSWMSIARRTFPSRLALKSLAGSCNAAPWAKVNFTLDLYDSPVQMMPSCDQTRVPIHFHSSTTSGSAALMSVRILRKVSARQSPSSAMRLSISAEADWPSVEPDLFMCSSSNFRGVVQQQCATGTEVLAAAIPLLALPRLAMADNIGPVTVGTRQDLKDHETTRSSGGYCAAKTPREPSTSTPVLHLPVSPPGPGRPDWWRPRGLCRSGLPHGARRRAPPPTARSRRRPHSPPRPPPHGRRAPAHRQRPGGCALSPRWDRVPQRPPYAPPAPSGARACRRHCRRQ